jgi:hypothetical protein
MRHQRHYTLEQANAIRPWVAERVLWARTARARLAALGARLERALQALDPASGGSYPGRDAARSVVEVNLAMGQLEAVDVVLRDVERGLVDFPALRDGQEVYLCWLIHEDEISCWHELDAGFAGRRPL